MLTTHLVNAYEHALVQLHVCGLGFYADATFEEGAAVLKVFRSCFRAFDCFRLWSRVLTCCLELSRAMVCFQEILFI